MPWPTISATAPSAMPARRRWTRRWPTLVGSTTTVQTFRIVTRLERRYADFDGLNLTSETLEGLVKHNGPLPRRRLRPWPSIRWPGGWL